MLKLHLAFLVLENKITLEQAKQIEQKIGSNKIPETIEEIIGVLKEVGL